MVVNFKRLITKQKGASRPLLLCLTLPLPGNSAANPSLSAEKLKRLQVVGFEGVL